MPKASESSASSTKSTPQPRQTPVKMIRLGRIKAAIWENEVDGRKMYNVTFARTYMDDQKKFHDSESFGRDDLLLVAKVADQAHTFIFDRLAAQKADEQS